MALDDKSGRAEVALFDDAFRRYAELLTTDRIVVVEGTASVDDFSGGYRIAAKQVWELDQARANLARGVEIQLNGCGPEDVAQICSALRPFRAGNAPVWVEFRGHEARARLKLGDEWRVRVSGDLIASLAGIRGVEATRIIY